MKRIVKTNGNNIASSNYKGDTNEQHSGNQEKGKGKFKLKNASSHRPNVLACCS